MTKGDVEEEEEEEKEEDCRRSGRKMQSTSARLDARAQVCVSQQAESGKYKVGTQTVYGQFQ